MWLIDSEAAIKRLRLMQAERETQGEKELLETVIEMLRREPSPDLTKYEFWLYDKEKGKFVCTGCRREVTWEGRTKFCPECGGTMLGFETEEERLSRLNWGLALSGARVFLTEEGDVIETIG